MHTIEFRCPVHPRKLFGKSTVETMPAAGQQVLEFACRECRREQGTVVIHLLGADGSWRDTLTLTPVKGGQAAHDGGTG